MSSKKLSSFEDLSSIVYSTDPNFVFPSQEQEQETLANKDQMLIICLDKKARKGKQVTLISNFIGTKKDLEALAKHLKTKCSCGGTVDNGTILIQGDKRELVNKILLSLDYKTKLR